MWSRKDSIIFTTIYFQKYSQGANNRAGCAREYAKAAKKQRSKLARRVNLLIMEPFCLLKPSSLNISVSSFIRLHQFHRRGCFLSFCLVFVRMQMCDPERVFSEKKRGFFTVETDKKRQIVIDWNFASFTQWLTPDFTDSVSFFLFLPFLCASLHCILLLMRPQQ